VNVFSSYFIYSQIVLAVVACGDRLSETLVMIKSAIIFTQQPLNIIILADDPLIASFKEKVNVCLLNASVSTVSLVSVVCGC
jgi:hypothetical protein